MVCVTHKYPPHTRRFESPWEPYHHMSARARWRVLCSTLPSSLCLSLSLAPHRLLDASSPASSQRRGSATFPRASLPPTFRQTNIATPALSAKRGEQLAAQCARHWRETARHATTSPPVSPSRADAGQLQQTRSLASQMRREQHSTRHVRPAGDTANDASRVSQAILRVMRRVRKGRLRLSTPR